jgi:hypothetical protein
VLPNFSDKEARVDSSDPAEFKLGGPFPSALARLRTGRVLMWMLSFDELFSDGFGWIARDERTGDLGRSRVGLKGSTSGRDCSVGFELE